jgi:hypothetical protein
MRTIGFENQLVTAACPKNDHRYVTIEECKACPYLERFGVRAVDCRYGEPQDYMVILESRDGDSLEVRGETSVVGVGSTMYGYDTTVPFVPVWNEAGMWMTQAQAIARRDQLAKDFPNNCYSIIMRTAC